MTTPISSGDPQSAAPSMSDDTRRMLPIYIAVVVVEAVTLIGLWMMQTTFA